MECYMCKLDKTCFVQREDSKSCWAGNKNHLQATKLVKQNKRGTKINVLVNIHVHVPPFMECAAHNYSRAVTV